MKTHKKIRSVLVNTKYLFALFVLTALSIVSVPGQSAPSPQPAQENIFAGSLVIPMDNFHQGNNAETTFNLRAYGLANLLLQNDIPVKWVIKYGKSKDDVDFTADVTRIAGTAGVDGPATVSFSGGPFVIPREFNTVALRTLISNFNAAGDAPVTVYEMNADALADVRYTLTHKPKIAVGPDGGNYGTGVHQDLFDRAGIPDYTSVDDDITDAGKCFTLATQAHSVNPDYVNLYRDFVESGGNLLLQCASVDTFENHNDGHFQTTAFGYSLYSTNNPPANAVDTPLVYPAGSMPFNQFIGELANQDGLVTEFSYAPGGGPANGNTPSVRNSGKHFDKIVASASELRSIDSGGVVFTLGGHDYTRTTTGASDIEKLNGQRMILNTIFVPAETICHVEPSSVIGYKSVRRFNERQGGPALIAGDILEWTIDYLNNSPAHQFDFQIRDVVGAIGGNQTLFRYDDPVDPQCRFWGVGTDVPSLEISYLRDGTVATINPNFDGIGDDSTSDMLAPGAYLPVNGRIQIKIRTRINCKTTDGLDLPVGTKLYNQTVGSSAEIVPSPSTHSDAVDVSNTSIFEDGHEPADDSIGQIQNGAIIDPTQVIINGPTAADVSIEGSVRTADGLGIQNARLLVTDAATGESRYVITNAFGFFRIDDLEAGRAYMILVTHKRYSFPDGPQIFSVSDSITGLTFTGTLPRGGNVIQLTKKP